MILRCLFPEDNGTKMRKKAVTVFNPPCFRGKQFDTLIDKQRLALKTRVWMFPNAIMKNRQMSE